MTAHAKARGEPRAVDRRLHQEAPCALAVGVIPIGTRVTGRHELIEFPRAAAGLERNEQQVAGADRIALVIIEALEYQLEVIARTDVALKVNGKDVAQRRVRAAMSLHFTSTATFDIVTDFDSPVSLDYFDQAPFPFNGTIGTTKIEYPEQAK